MMKTLLFVFVLLLMSDAFVTRAAAQPALPHTGTTAVPVIMDTDNDDTFALTMANHFMEAGEADILAIVTNTASVNSPAATQVTDTFYGHPGIPVGACQSGCVRTAHDVADAVSSSFRNHVGLEQDKPMGSTDLIVAAFHRAGPPVTLSTRFAVLLSVPFALSAPFLVECPPRTLIRRPTCRLSKPQGGARSGDQPA